MPVTVGGLVGQAEVTNSNICDVTLTADVLRGTDTVAKGIIIVCASKSANYESFGSGSGTLRPSVYEYPTRPTQVNPYFGYNNSLIGQVVDADDTLVINYTSPTHYFRSRGGYLYLVLQSLHTGDTIRVDYSGAPSLEWLGVKMYSVSGLLSQVDTNDDFVNPASFSGELRTTGGTLIEGDLTAAGTTASRLPVAGFNLGFTGFCTFIAIQNAASGSPTAFSWTGDGASVPNLSAQGTWVHNIDGSRYGQIGFSWYDFGTSEYLGGETLNYASGNFTFQFMNFNLEGPGFPYVTREGIFLDQVRYRGFG